MTKEKHKLFSGFNSIVFKWMSVVTLTIASSFLIFSVVIYSAVSSESMDQETKITKRVATDLTNNLNNLNDELTIANVVPNLSPRVRSLLEGNKKNSSSKLNKLASPIFNDELISAISNPDISVSIFNLDREIVFTGGKDTPKFKAIKKNDKLLDTFEGKKQVQYLYEKIYSQKKHKLIGYLVVKNRMSSYNHMIIRLASWMMILSIIAIFIFIGVAFLVVNSVVGPIKQISAVAREVDKDPNSQVRIPNLQRNDEIQEMATSFNQMLDRMQRYIDQQKEFVSDVSHELRTPVAVIEGHLSMLQRWGKDDPEVLEESISAANQEASRMKHLIQEMLDLTRAEQVQVNYPDEVTEVKENVKRVVSDLQMVHPDFNLNLDLENLKDDDTIQIYHGHLEQLLVILIDNAIKYSLDRKEVNISAGTSHQTCTIIVQDYGEGISKADQEKIFNRFFRVDKARTRERGGNGLGLAIATKLVASYNGQIRVESVPGQGSQFILTFPLLSHNVLKKLQEKKAH
ncbi:MAG: HAMP domain-containing histidine kinase [Lactobacillus sp.]|nr:HAMP domain-containing histidine kinase [Lactobacillus sp.]